MLSGPVSRDVASWCHRGSRFTKNATRAENFPSLVFDPFRKVRSQGCAPGGQTVVVISPVSNLAVISTYDRDSGDRNRNPSGESSVERLGDSDLKCPLRDHMLTADERLVGLQKVIWIKFPCFPEEFGQTLFVPKLQSNAVILITKIRGETSDSVLNLFLV
jgi:hypothetical protein